MLSLSLLEQIDILAFGKKDSNKSNKYCIVSYLLNLLDLFSSNFLFTISKSTIPITICF